MRRLRRARNRLPHVRCGHYQPHAAHKWARFYRTDSWCNGESMP